MYKNLIHELNSNVTYHNNWPYDQYYISKYIFQNNEQFVIFVPDILNCPTGKVLRHNWFKDEQMYDDLNTLIKTEDIMADKTSFIETDYYDDKNNFQSCSEYVQSI
jgi:predicted nucleic-acid-binding protein